MYFFIFIFIFNFLNFLKNPVIISVSATFIFLLVVYNLHENKNGEENKNKKKKYHPIAGTILNQMFNFNRLHDYMTDLATKHKTYRLITTFGFEIYTSDPVNVEYILKTNFHNYGKGNYNYTNLKDLLGDGIFTVDGDKWRNQRKVSSHEFSTRVLRTFSTLIFKRNAIKLANILSMDITQTFDIQDLMMKSTLDSIFKVAFGVELDSMCGSNEEGRIFSNAFDEASAITLKRYVDPLWKIKKVLNIGFEAKLKKNVKLIDAFVYKLIRAKIDQMQLPNNDLSMKKDDILSRFLQSNDWDTKYMRDIILNFIIAGKDTTASSLSWFIYMICIHPNVQENISREIRDAVQLEQRLTFEEFSERLNEHTLEKLHYLHAALTETLRLYPGVPVDAKVCFSDDKMPDGFNVRKGDMVAYQPYAMGRMKFIWGDDAYDFKPERWIDENGCFQQQSPFKFTAFQAGPRVCLGKEFAYRQMKIFGAILLHFFVFKLSNDKQVVNYKTMINLHIDNGLHIRVSNR